MSCKKPARNAPCLCGSGKKYKHWCYRTRGAGDLDLGTEQQQPHGLSNERLVRRGEVGLDLVAEF